MGRERELATLRDLLAQVERGRGQLLGIVGEPGVGKSRLCDEFTRSSRTHSWLILGSSPAAYGKDTLFLPVIDLLKAYFQIDLHDKGRMISEKIAGKLRLDEALGQTLPALLALLDVPVENSQWQSLEPPQRRQRTLDAVNRPLLRESQVQPRLLIVENLHWIDTETQAFLDTLIESLPAARILLLVNYRPEYQHGWGSKTYYTQLRLDPLSPESADELLRALLGEDGNLTPLKQRLIDRTEGNLFFLEEGVCTLVEAHVLVGERGAYSLATVPQTIQVSATVQAVLATRIDRLPPEDKRLLQLAAVIGTNVPFPLLRVIAERRAEQLLQGLAHLQATEFLYEKSVFPDRSYAFKHVLAHEVVYGSLLPEWRRALHTKIVEALEQLSSNHLTQQVEGLAHHALQGEVWDKALHYCRQAGNKAFTCSAHREAVRYFEQALWALRHLPARRDRHAHRDPPEREPAEDHYRQALALAEELGMRPLVAHGHLGLGKFYAAIGRRAEARAALTAAIALYRSMEMTFWLPQAEGRAGADGMRLRFFGDSCDMEISASPCAT